MLGGEKLSSTSLAHAQEMLASERRAKPARTRKAARDDRRRATPTGSAPPSRREGSAAGGSSPVPRAAGGAERGQGHSRPARDRPGHRHLRVRKVRGPACARGRRLLLRRQPAARAAARLPSPRDAAPRPAHRHRRRRAQRRLAAAPAAAARRSCSGEGIGVQPIFLDATTARAGAALLGNAARPSARRPRRAGRGDRARAPAARRPARALDRDRHQPAAADAAARAGCASSSAPPTAA